ncbi:hypothetical protein BH20ACT13_BH20ACT13_20300 [soil metagenome]
MSKTAVALNPHYGGDLMLILDALVPPSAPFRKMVPSLANLATRVPAAV